MPAASAAVLAALLTAVQPIAPAPAEATWSTLGAGSGRASAVTLAAVTTVSATCAVSLSATVAWTPAPPADGYVVSRTTDNIHWTTVATTSSTSITDAGLASAVGLSLTWRVTALSGANWQAPPSAPSNTLSITQLGNCAP